MKHHAMKECGGCRGMALRILNFSVRWKWVVSFTLRSLYPRVKGHRYLLNRRLGGHCCQRGRFGEETNVLPLLGIKPPFLGRPANISALNANMSISAVRLYFIMGDVIYQLRSALFWNITQRRVVILYRCFGTTYRSQLQGSFWDFFTLEYGTR
jgi:hypothetical protein